MTTETKIQGLLDYIKVNLPDGCSGIDEPCTTCPLKEAESGSYGEVLCELLGMIALESGIWDFNQDIAERPEG